MMFITLRQCSFCMLVTYPNPKDPIQDSTTVKLTPTIRTLDLWIVNYPDRIVKIIVVFKTNY